MLIEKKRFDMEELIKEVISETILVIASHNINFTCCDDAFVKADRDKIGSVLSNLLSNAVKYSPQETEVHISCQKKDNYLEVSVKDEGIGISQTDREKIFERYYRVQSTELQHVAGFGIGLYLSSEIIKHHDGFIRVESNDGPGSTFSFLLPLS
jgi:two-component system sensor histidine kinase VicK